MATAGQNGPTNTRHRQRRLRGTGGLSDANRFDRASDSADPTNMAAARLHHSEAQKSAAHDYSVPANTRHSTASLDAYANGSQAVSGTSPTADDPGSGFAYDAAAIGAGLALAIVLLATGSIVAVRRRSQLHHS